jgi:hypothetical protein
MMAQRQLQERYTMTPQYTDTSASEGTDPVPALLGRVFAEAPIPLKKRLLEHLLKPLGLLSLATVCNGAFANVALNRNWAIQPELVKTVDSEQIMALTAYVQQVSVHAVTGLSQVLTASPWLQGSVAASALVAMLIKRAREQHLPDPRDLEDFAA